MLLSRPVRAVAILISELEFTFQKFLLIVNLGVHVRLAVDQHRGVEGVVHAYLLSPVREEADAGTE